MTSDTGRSAARPVSSATAPQVLTNSAQAARACGHTTVFAEAARLFRPGGRLAVADIVTEETLTEAIVCNVDLWASCIGGAPQQGVYLQAIQSAGLAIREVGTNPYKFLSVQARGDSTQHGVKSSPSSPPRPEQTGGTP